MFSPSSLLQVISAPPAVSFEKRFLIFLHTHCSTETKDAGCFPSAGGEEVESRGDQSEVLSLLNCLVSQSFIGFPQTAVERSN